MSMSQTAEQDKSESECSTPVNSPRQTAPRLSSGAHRPLNSIDDSE